MPSSTVTGIFCFDDCDNIWSSGYVGSSTEFLLSSSLHLCYKSYQQCCCRRSWWNTNIYCTWIIRSSAPHTFHLSCKWFSALTNYHNVHAVDENHGLGLMGYGGCQYDHPLNGLFLQETNYSYNYAHGGSTCWSLSYHSGSNGCDFPNIGAGAGAESTNLYKIYSGLWYQSSYMRLEGGPSECSRTDQIIIDKITMLQAYH